MHGAAALRADDVGAPAIAGEGLGDAGGEGDGGGAPEVTIVVIDDILREVEGLDRELAVAAAVGGAQEETGGAQADVAGIFVVAKAGPLGVLRALEGGLEVLDAGEVGEAGEAEHARAGVGEERDVGHRADGGAALEEGEVLGAGADVEDGADDPVGLAAEDAEGAAVEVLI